MMRTSRISRDTSKVISATTAIESARRVTRSSLSRFAHTGVKTEDTDIETDEVVVSNDIEDVIPGVRKRKRTLSTAPIKKTSSGRTTKVKTEIDESTTTTISASLSQTPSRARKPARQAMNPSTGEVEIHPPSNWREMYSIVKEMRTTGTARNAAVDTMGCETYTSESAPPALSARDKRYHTLTSLMLSSQTKDTTNYATMQRLQRELPTHLPGAPPGLNLENILAVEPQTLNELIWAVGFHNNKTRYIKATAEILRDQYASDIPDTAEGLMALPGVGPKMAYLCLSSAWGRDEGIGVDVHVHRITNLWGWNGAGAGTKGPEETRIMLQSWLPRELWHEINWLLVGFGQTVCTPVGRKCGECELGLQGLCKSAERGKVVSARKEREKVEMVLKGEGEGEVEKVEVVKEEEEVLVEEGVVNAPMDVGVKVEGQEELP